MKDEDLKIKLEAWLNDDLPDEEAAEMQHLVETDPAALALLDLVKNRQAVVEAVQEAEYRKKVAAWKENPAPKPVTYSLWWKVGGAAALMALVAYFSLYKKNPSPEHIDDAPQSPGNNTPAPPSAPMAELPTPGVVEPPPTPKIRQVPGRKPAPPVIVLRLHSYRPFEGDLSLNFEMDTLKAGEKDKNWVAVDHGLYVSNEITDQQKDPDFNYKPSQEMGDSGKRGSAYNLGLDTLKTDPVTGIQILSSIPNTNPEYPLAQKALAFYYLNNHRFSEGIACYQRYREKVKSAETDWMLLGFYLHDYQNHKRETAQLLNTMSKSTGDPMSDHKYRKPAEKLKKYLKIQ